MASLFTAKAEDIPFEFQAEFGDAAEKERLAQLMAQQRAIIQKGMQPQMVSGHYVRASPMQHLADMLAAYYQGKAVREGGSARSAVARKMAGAENQAVQDVTSLAAGSQVATEEGDYGPGERRSLPGRDVQRSPDPLGAEAKAAASQWERVRKLGAAMTKRREATNSAAARNLTGAGSAQLAATGIAPTQPSFYKADDTFGDVTDIPGLLSPEGKPIKGQQNLQTKEWKEKGTDRAPKISVDARSFGPETDFFKRFQVQRADQAAILAGDAEAAARNLEGLGRIKKVLAQGPVVAGPELTARAELGIRNFFSQYGLPIDKAMDSRNARLTAEGASFLAAKIIAGGRAITDQDINRIAKTWPGIESGIPYEALPAFINQLEAIAMSQVESWNRFYQGIPEADRAKLPTSLREVKLPGQGWSSEDERRLQELEAKRQAGTLK